MIIVYQLQTGDWVARRKGSPEFAPRGVGPSSVEAHCNLLEREAERKARQHGHTDDD
jgi:hypothetical protein